MVYEKALQFTINSKEKYEKIKKLKNNILFKSTFLTLRPKS